VKTVATVASQADWMSADVKMYQTMVAIDEPIQDLKPGMSAEVTIFASNTLENVLTVPLQAILGTPAAGAQRKCFVLNGTEVEERDIIVGMSNDKMAEIRDGLQAGEEVVLNPRALLNDKSRLRPAGGKAKAGEESVDQPAVEGQGGPPNGQPGEWKKGGGDGERRKGGGDGERRKGGGGEWKKGGQAGGGGGDMDEMRKRMEEFQRKMKAGTPAERKQMLNSLPDEFREKARQRYKDQGLEIAP
jgi:hypothetical protein